LLYSRNIYQIVKAVAFMLTKLYRQSEPIHITIILTRRNGISYR